MTEVQFEALVAWLDDKIEDALDSDAGRDSVHSMLAEMDTRKKFRESLGLPEFPTKDPS